ncbi:ABC transporter permease [Erythrobacter donghaensis]|uniref:ABC transporter permease n=1 Tax=Erythrobacter donghaensis TaxID=267135 RepID=UPI000A38C4BB|nr:FtsX-like permease family protein [Erythrobacter donghaensis]
MNVAATLYRSFSRHPQFALINLGGLALGIAVFLVLFLFVRFETSFDNVLPGADKVWVVDRKLQFGEAEPVGIPSRVDMVDLLQADYPGTQGARLVAADATVKARGQAAKEQIGLVDPAWFDLFPVPVFAGDTGSALSRPDGAVLTRSAAAKHLRPGDPIGQTITLVLGTEERVLRVAAVIEDMPVAMTYRPQVMARLMPDQETFFEGSSGVTTFLKFTDQASAAAMQRNLKGFNARHPDPNFQGPDNFMTVTEAIVPLASLHLKDPRDGLVVATLGALGLIALGLAIINYVNLATARADLRAREVALRKVVGASRTSLIIRFLAEALAAAVLAGIAGLALAELALPFVNAAGGLSLEIEYVGARGILAPLAAVILVTGVAAGAYPAFVLSRFQPAAVLSSNRSPGTGRRGAILRTLLVVIQFALAIALVICTTVLFAQARHLQSVDLGYQRDGLIMVSSFADPNLDPAQRSAIRRAIEALPGVTGTAISGVVPTGGSYSISKSSGGDIPAEIDLLEGTVGRSFADVYQVRLLAGRLFDPGRFPADLSVPIEAAVEDSDTTKPTKRNLVINRAAATALGFATPQDAVGKELKAAGTFAIIGVIEDINFADPTVAVKPFAYALANEGDFPPNLTVRHSGNAEAVLQRIEAVWQQRAAGVPFAGNSVNALLYKSYLEGDVQRSRLFAFGTVLAVIVGALGLYGLAAFNTARRVREIGIRKSLGASSGAIVRLLIGQFLRPVLIANVIAWPLAWLAMREWLSGFSERIALSPVYFIAASVLAIAIAVITVLAHSLRASRIAPAEALRHD